MPILTVLMYSGRTQRKTDRLAEAMTEDISKILNIQKEEVIIVFQEAPHENWYSSDICVNYISYVDDIVTNLFKLKKIINPLY